MESQKGRVLESALLPLSMVVIQILVMGMLILSKIVMNNGMQPYVLLGYRNIIGAIFVAPFAFFFEREMGKKLNMSSLVWIFINATLAISMALGLYYYGLRDTNAAYSVNFLNLIPIVTFIIAVILRLERMRLRSTAGKVKVLGTLLCVGGTMIVSLYKGKALHLWPTHLLKLHHGAKGAEDHHHWLRGTLFLVCSCLSYAFWFITQVKLFKIFPSKYWATMLTCVAGSLETVVIGIIIDREKSAWMLKWDLQLLTIVYSGVFNTGLTFCLILWAVARRGPTYPSMFNSLSVIFTMIADSVLLGTNITVGSLLGTFVIIGGLYAFLWGKGNEAKVDGTKVAGSDETQTALDVNDDK
ncbi:WAT1-related protein At5g64700-like isoform X1 [Ananas comosus]|uniref:WAT1-related protein n=1 Tax=Ananas comosus TaxID=4615 RepID=A0A6P5H379_ANACO|nr:WAT1-related protein At5g64700-like isoform X1 [Ananas comosus]